MKTLVANATIIDGTGRDPYVGSILVDNDVVDDIFSPGQDFSGPVNVVDASGKVAMPGIINCHVHLGMDAGPHPMNLMAASTVPEILMQAIDSAQKVIKKGITTVRDCGAKEFEILLLRDHVRKGTVRGPRILAGQALKISGGHFVGRVVDSPAEAKKAAREQIHAGVNFIKLMASGGLGRPNEEPGAAELDVDEMRAAISEGKKHGLRSAAHAHGKQSMLNAIEAGVDTLEHATFMDDEVIEAILANNLMVVPTFQPYYAISTGGVEAGLPAYMVESAKRVYEEKLPRFCKALRAGVRFAFGTDAGAPFTPHDDVVTEAVIMNEMGMSPMDVIVSCTMNAAKALGLERQLGSIEKGKSADIVLLNGNPLDKLTNLGDVYMVMKDGQVVL